jgi:hypothetical protein
MRWILLLGLVMSGSFCKNSTPETGPTESVGPIALADIPWDGTRVSQHLKELTAAPHYFGSPRQKELAAYLEAEARKLELSVQVDTFQATVPDPAALTGVTSMMQNTTLQLTGYNVYARLPIEGATCVILIGSHYDSKRLEGVESLGANDSGSSSAALLELMRAFQTPALKQRLRCSLMAVWFDGEEAYLPEWLDGETRHPSGIKDHLYGSRHLAGRLEACGAQQCLPQALGGERVQQMLLLDMIGMPNAQLTLDRYSTPELLALAQRLDKAYYQGRLYRDSYPKPVMDDHIPFLAKGIPSLNLIDFENLNTWHTSQDRLETLALSSIEDISKLAVALIVAWNSGG